LADAHALVKNLGINAITLPISTAVDAVEATLEDTFKQWGKSEPDVTEENIQARMRGVLLMAISNKTGRMLLTTGNKSEMAVGYATLYGDMAGGFAVIKDVYKTQVFALAAYINRKEEIIPQNTIDKPPSAELRPNQKDSDSLPDYDVLDAILQATIESRLSVDEIVALGFERSEVVRVVRLLQNSEYKRRQAPPGVKITARAFGRDRRYPMTHAFRES
jgi:NAD+ synthase (glutamine-hydrolysing)